MGVWNGWGYGIAIFRALNCQIYLKFGENCSFCGISGIFPENPASEEYFSDSGKSFKWPFHMSSPVLRFKAWSYLTLGFAFLNPRTVCVWSLKVFENH